MRSDILAELARHQITKSTTVDGKEQRHEQRRLNPPRSQTGTNVCHPILAELARCLSAIPIALIVYALAAGFCAVGGK